MTSMSVPEPVMSLAVQPVSKDSGGQVSRFLSILCVDELFLCIIIQWYLRQSISFFFASSQRLWIVFRKRIQHFVLAWILRADRSDIWMFNMILLYNLVYKVYFLHFKKQLLCLTITVPRVDNHLWDGRAAFGHLRWTHSERI